LNLTQFQRRRYTSTHTPIERLHNLSAVLGGPSIYVKRDDLLGLAAGGNKTRKLEFLVADALEKNADILITCGGIQSNHCRLTVSAAVKEKMKCILVLDEGHLERSVPSFNGNYFLYHLLGVEKIEIVPRGANLTEEMKRVASEAIANGHHPYVIPLGGSNAIGITGYVDCALEILTQTSELSLDLTAIVCASGSGGMQAGLVTGFYGSKREVSVIGIDVGVYGGGRTEQEERVFRLVQETSSHVGISQFIPRKAVTCLDEYVGPGYTLASPEMVEAVQLFARTEGILLDPVYTGKAAAGLIGLIRKGAFRREDNILFMHSGGTPALYASASLFE
jgi:D-cysteine desulfhydrase